LSPELELWQIWGIRQLWQIWGIRHLLVTFGGSRDLIHTGVLRSAQDDTSKQRQEQDQLPHPPPKEGGRVGHPALSPELELRQLWATCQLRQIWGTRHLLVTFGGSRDLIHTGVLRSAQDDTSKQRQEQDQLPHPPPKEGGRVGHPALSPELELRQLWATCQLRQIWGTRHLLVTFGGSRDLIHTGVLRSAQDDISKQRQEQEQD